MQLVIAASRLLGRAKTSPTQKANIAYIRYYTQNLRALFMTAGERECV